MSTMEGASSSWNVFVPYKILYEPSGYLISTVDYQAGVVCVHGITEKEQPEQDFFGYWQRCVTDRIPGPSWVPACKLELKNSSNGETICRLAFNSGQLEINAVTCVIFDPVELKLSYILPPPSSVYLQTNKSKALPLQSENVIGNDRTVKTSPFEDGFKAAKHSVHIVSIVSKKIKSWQARCGSDSTVKSFHNVTASSSILEQLGRWFLQVMPWLLLKMICLIGWVLNLEFLPFGIQRFQPLRNILMTPGIFQHLQFRASCFKRVFSLRRSKFNTFLLFNCYGQQFVDSSLGVCLILVLLHYQLDSMISSYVLDWADDVAQKLTDLVQWLMGAPAGLKLNAQLTKFLGHFFIYHIYLWTGYLSLLRNVLPVVIRYSSVVGVLGLSAQLCLVRDLISMLTLHIYCFYVYAARIFNLQVYALGSLWRLFRGKKWNVLRARVDSACYNTDQLFVGTLLFTVLLFLLPTTALYYAVFTLLRLMVLTAQGLVTKVVSAVTMTPVFTIVLSTFAPKFVAGSVVFTVSYVPEDDYDNCLVLTMQTCQVPFKELFQMTSSVLPSSSSQTHSWAEFLSHLLTGQLIYPWVEPRSVVKNSKTT